MTTANGGLHVLDEMTWMQVEAALEAGVRNVIFAVGATEQHGPHLPLTTDALIGTATARMVAARLGGTIVGPTVPFGVSPHHMSFPGTVTLTEEVFLDVVEGYARSLASHGFDNILITPSHGGNFAPVAHLVERLGGRIGDSRVIAHTDLLQLLSAFEGIAAEDSISPEACGSHAGDFETSIVLALRPDLVDMSRAVPGFMGGFDEETASKLFAGGTQALAANGVLGDPVAALATRGERYLDAIVELITEYFRAELAAADAVKA